MNSIRPRRSLAAGLLAALLVPWPLAAQESPEIPDFSGLWARMNFGLEQPPSGLGPITNLTRRADGAGDGSDLVGDYTHPILKPASAQRVKQQGEISKTGVAFPDPSNQCAPQQPPFILRQQEIQLLQEKDRVTILYMLDHHVRHVRLKASHPAHVMPSWSGDSVGHYDGDTLVVDTVGMKVGPVSMADAYGSPQSEAMHVTERYRIVDFETASRAIEFVEKEYGHVDGANGNGVFTDANDKGRALQLQFTVDDPNVFTASWSARVTYTKAGSQWQEQVCAENVAEYYDSKNTAVPTSKNPDF